MMISQLNDEKTYKKLNSNPNYTIMQRKLKVLITRYKPLLADSEYKYLNQFFLKQLPFMAILKYKNRKFCRMPSKNKIKNLSPFQNLKT